MRGLCVYQCVYAGSFFWLKTYPGFSQPYPVTLLVSFFYRSQHHYHLTGLTATTCEVNRSVFSARSSWAPQDRLKVQLVLRDRGPWRKELNPGQ